MNKLIITVMGLFLAGAAVGDNNVNENSSSTSSSQHRSSVTGSSQVDAANVNQQARRLGVEELNDLEDKEIVNMQGEAIGEVDRLATDRATGEIILVVGLDGSMGDNMKEVTVPIKDVRRMDEDKLQTALSKSQLQQQRDIDPWDGTLSQIIQNK